MTALQIYNKLLEIYPMLIPLSELKKSTQSQWKKYQKQIPWLWELQTAVESEERDRKERARKYAQQRQY